MPNGARGLVRRIAAKLGGSDRWARRWPTIRAALVTYHVLAVVVLAFPSPGGVMHRPSWENPTVQNEFRIWSERLRSLGLDMTQRELDRTLWDASKRYLRARDHVIAPFTPYATYAGVRQSWRLFVAPQRYPVRLEIAVREQGKWRDVYVTRSSEHTWLRETLNLYRMRRASFQTAWDRERPHFNTLCDWLADRAARDFPEATELMVRQLRYRTPAPAEARAGQTVLEPKYLAREVRDLGSRRSGPSRSMPEPR
jgi:hypothetical protein